jgi:uncharacterized membrane protein YfcA
MELLFEKNGVRITPHVATFGDTSYQIANVANVHVTRRNRRNPVAFAVFLLGLVLLVGAIAAARATALPDDYFSMAAAGIGALLAALLLQLVWPGRLHVLTLSTSGGEVEAIASRDRELVSNIHRALEEAFVARARQPVSP